MRPDWGAKSCLDSKSGKPVNGTIVGASPARESPSPLSETRYVNSSTPVAEELDLIPHSREGLSGPKMQETAQLLANREPLLRRQNYSGVFSAGADPLRVKSIEIGDVERVEDTPMFGGEGQLFIVRLLGEAGVQSRDHDNATRTKSRD